MKFHSSNNPFRYNPCSKVIIWKKLYFRTLKEVFILMYLCIIIRTLDYYLPVIQTEKDLASFWTECRVKSYRSSALPKFWRKMFWRQFTKAFEIFFKFEFLDLIKWEYDYNRKWTTWRGARFGSDWNLQKELCRALSQG